MNTFSYITLWTLAVNLLACGTQKNTHSPPPTSLPSRSPIATPRTIDKRISKPSTCVRSGTYNITSNDTFYLADLEGNLPPVNQRKVSVDIFDNCQSHTRVDETLSVHVDHGKTIIEFSKESLGDFKISQININNCILEFNIRNQGEHYMLERATFIIDYSEKKPKAHAKDIWLLTKLDGELGEHMVSCATDSATLQLTSAEPIHSE